MLHGNRIVVGYMSKQRAARCSAFRTPAGHWVCASVNVESHTLLTKHLKQIEEEMQSGRQQRYTLSSLQLRQGRGDRFCAWRPFQRRWFASCEL
jgi:hypothetical protein